MEAVFERIGEAGDEVHAAAGAAAGEFGVDLGIHGAGEIGDGLRGQKRKEGAAAHYTSRTQRKVMLVVAESGVFFVLAATR